MHPTSTAGGAADRDGHLPRALLERVGRPTIHDVATSAGVSPSTVSKVINGRYGVSPQTVERVMAVVEQLGYESSLVASSLRRGSTNVIGVLVAEFEPFALSLLQGVSEALHDTAFDVLAYAGRVSAGDHTGWERRSLSRLGGTLIDGAILVTPGIDPPSDAIPVVSIDRHSGAPGRRSVDTDNLDGGLIATRHLLELGHRRIAHIRGRGDLESAQLRERGYRQALHDAGVSVDPELIRDGGYRAATTTSAVADLLDLPEPPTAIFAANDLSALRAMEMAAERGLRVPDDLSVIGFDDIPAAIVSSPPLTTVRQPLHEMGRIAARLLLDELQGGTTSADHVRLPAELVTRGSTARA